MDVVERIKKVLDAEKDDAQLDKFLSDVRESLASSDRQFIAYGTAILVSLVVYYLVVYEGSKAVSFSGVQLTDTSLFRRVFLVVPAALSTAMACIGYLRRLQREVFDYLSISRYRILGTTGLHELRLPADYVLGLFVIKEEEGLVGKILALLIGVLWFVAFAVAPAAYVIEEAAKNVHVFGWNDILCVAASAIAIVLSICGLLVVRLAARIKAV